MGLSPCCPSPIPTCLSCVSDAYNEPEGVEGTGGEEQEEEMTGQLFQQPAGMPHLPSTPCSKSIYTHSVQGGQVPPCLDKEQAPLRRQRSPQLPSRQPPRGQEHTECTAQCMEGRRCCRGSHQCLGYSEANRHHVSNLNPCCAQRPAFPTSRSSLSGPLCPGEADTLNQKQNHGHRESASCWLSMALPLKPRA